MRDLLLALSEKSWLRESIRCLGFLIVAIAMTWPLAAELDQSLLGYPTIDSQDTVTLRGLIAAMLTNPEAWPLSTGAYYPVGYPILLLTPNLLDHLTAAPFIWVFPFPLSDNLWWLTVLVLNGWTAHRLGRRVGQNEGAGWLCGLAFMASEPLMREANLHHAPQAMLFWAPLYVEAILDLREKNGSMQRAATRAGIFLGLSGLSYWYLAYFLVLSSLPLLWGIQKTALMRMGGVTAILTGPFLLPQLIGWGARPLTSHEVPLAPAKGLSESFDVISSSTGQFVAQHGSEPAWFWSGAPIDLSNQISLILLMAAILGARNSRHRTPLIMMAAIGGLMVLGPYLRWGGELVTVGERGLMLPFGWMAELHPFIERLTWPERWGFIVPLALLPLAARTPRPWLWIPLLFVEVPLRSQNLPTQTTPLGTQECWRQLSHAPGAILELPARWPELNEEEYAQFMDQVEHTQPELQGSSTKGIFAQPRHSTVSQAGLHQRLHGRPIVNPLLLPPGAETPKEWLDFSTSQPALIALRLFEGGKFPDFTTEGLTALREAGISAIAVDTEPGGVLDTPGKLNRFRVLRIDATEDDVIQLPSRALANELGTPIDLGCALVWWLEPDVAPPEPAQDGELWRKETAQRLREDPAPELDTLIAPTWNQLRRNQDSVSTR